MAGLSADVLVMDWIICGKCSKEFPANVYKRHLREVHRKRLTSSAAVSKIADDPRVYERPLLHRMIIKSTEDRWISSDSDSDYEVLEPEENLVTKEEHEALQAAIKCYEFIQKDNVDDVVKLEEDQVEQDEVVQDAVIPLEPQSSSSCLNMRDQSLDDAMATVPTPPSEETDCMGPDPGGLATSNRTAVVKPLEVPKEPGSPMDHFEEIEHAKIEDDPVSVSSNSFAPPSTTIHYLPVDPATSSESLISSQVPEPTGPSLADASNVTTIGLEAPPAQEKEKSPLQRLCDVTGMFIPMSPGLPGNSQDLDKRNPILSNALMKPVPGPSKSPAVLLGHATNATIDLPKAASMQSISPIRGNSAYNNYNLGPAPNMTVGRGMTPNVAMGYQQPLETRRIEIQPSYSNYRYMCHICESVFATGHGLASHVRSHNVVIKYTYACSQCKREFDKKQERDDHLRSHQVVVVDDDDDIQVLAEIPRLPAVGSPVLNRPGSAPTAAPVQHLQQPPPLECHPCYLCARKFSSAYVLKDHIFSFHTDKGS